MKTPISTHTEPPRDQHFPRRMARFCNCFACLCMGFAVLWPGLTVHALLGASPGELLQRVGLAGSAQTWGGSTYTTWQHIKVLLVLTLPAALTGLALAQMGQGFRWLAHGEVYWLRAHAALRRFAGWTVLACLAGPLAGTLATVLLTLNHPSGQKQLALAVSSMQFQSLLMAALVWVFAHLLLRAHAIAEENRQFV